MTADDARWMASALVLARRGIGRTAENPSVGCVIVREGRLLARARTGDGGRPHAEAAALSTLAGKAPGATAYVTLEPCAHQGRTPPCAKALIDAGVARVVTAMEDTDPRTKGKGHEMLRAAGITVTTGLMQDEAARVMAGFLSRIGRRRPHVTLKLATTLDGRIATASGESRWITGPAARHMVHGLRSRSDAVMVGRGTLETDDPLLDVRGFGPLPQPARIIVSSAAHLDPAGRLAGSAASVQVIVLHDEAATPDLPAGVVGQGCPVEGGRIDLSAALSHLAARGIGRVLCEGGGELAASLLSAGLVDELVVFSAGKLIGGEGRAAIGALGLDALGDAPQFRLQESRRVGADMVSIWSAPERHSAETGE